MQSSLTVVVFRWLAGAPLPHKKLTALERVILSIKPCNNLPPYIFSGQLKWLSGLYILRPRTKLLRYFNAIFNFAPCNHRVLKEQIRPPFPPLVKCCFGLIAQVCNSCVTANNIAIGEGWNGLLIFDGKHFCQGECQNRYFCNVSRQVFFCIL